MRHFRLKWWNDNNLICILKYKCAWPKHWFWWWDCYQLLKDTLGHRLKLLKVGKCCSMSFQYTLMATYYFQRWPCCKFSAVSGFSFLHFFFLSTFSPTLFHLCFFPLMVFRFKFGCNDFETRFGAGEALPSPFPANTGANTGAETRRSTMGQNWLIRVGLRPTIESALGRLQSQLSADYRVGLRLTTFGRLWSQLSAN